MSISTYTELKTALARWSHRADLAEDLDEVIDLAEAWLNSKLRLIEMEQTSTVSASTTSRYLGYPDDMLEMMTLNLEKDEYYAEVRYLTKDQLRRIATTSSAEPEYYTVRGDLEFNCVPTEAYTVEMHYIKKLGLSDAEPTNDVLTEYPNIYLFACRAQIADLVRDYKEEEKQTVKALDAIKAAEGRSKRKRGIRKQRMQSELTIFNRNYYNIETGAY